MPIVTSIVIALLASSASINATQDCQNSGDSKTLPGAVIHGDCLRNARHPDAAIAAYRHGLELDPKGSRDLYLGLSGAYLDSGRSQAAVDAALAADKISPNDPTVLVEVGVAYEDMEANTEALDYFQRTVALRPGDSRALRNVGFVYRQLKQPDAAVEALEKAVTIDPKDWKAHYNLSGAYADAYMNAVSEHATAKEAYVGKAIEHMREASRLNPDDAAVWHALANVLSQFRQNGRNDAERYEALKRAVGTRPDFYPALHDLVTHYTRVIADNPQDAALHADLAGVYRAMGRNEDFQRELDTAKALRPEMAANYDKRFATN